MKSLSARPQQEEKYGRLNSQISDKISSVETQKDKAHVVWRSAKLSARRHHSASRVFSL